MKIHEITNSQLDEDISRRGFLRGLGAAGVVGAGGYIANKQNKTDGDDPYREVDGTPVERPTNKPERVGVKPQQQKSPVQPTQLPRLSEEDAKKHEQFLLSCAKKSLPSAQVGPFMAQCAHETYDFRDLTERGDMDYFHKRYNNPRSMKILGNESFDDAIKYLGRGYIHLTGRDNYTRIGNALGLDLVNHPDLALKPQNAADIALYFWRKRVASKVKDPTNVRQVTAKVNGNKSLGLKDRMNKAKKYAQQLITPKKK